MIKNKRIIVTGGAGFLGSHIVNLLNNDNVVFVPRSNQYNLTKEECVAKMFDDFPNTDILIHAAANIGGIGYSASHSATQFDTNALINLFVLHQSFLHHIKKFVGVGSVCEYPASTPCPFKEETLWNGYPVETNDGYGLTKRMLLAQQIAYKKQYGFNSIHLLPVNLYGPKDKFDDAHSHVIPALIKKIYKAVKNGENVVEVWGTGNESREFIYVSDCARAIVLATEFYNNLDPVNIGSGQEITVKQIATNISKILGYKGKFVFLNNGLGGQQRRVLDVSKAEKLFHFKPNISFSYGLNETIKYYINYVYDNNL